jgi:hypothetical protein
MTAGRGASSAGRPRLISSKAGPPLIVSRPAAADRQQAGRR